MPKRSNKYLRDRVELKKKRCIATDYIAPTVANELKRLIEQAERNEREQQTLKKQ